MRLFLAAILASFFLLGSLQGARIELVAGGAGAGEKLQEPFDVEVGADGVWMVAEMTRGNRLLRVAPDGALTAFAGTGAKGYSGDGGPASAATFNGIHNFVVLSGGDLVIADSFNHALRKIDTRTGIITTFAGGKKGFAGDGGPASAAQFDTPIQIALDPARRHLFVADIENRRVRRIDLANGGITSVAGTGAKGAPADGALARESPLVDPRAVAVAGDGSFYILERGAHALRFVDAAGRIRTVAGTGKPGLSGDGGPALAATLNGPKYICLDRDGSVLIADAENHVIRRYTPADGRIARVAGTGKKGSAGIGDDPLACELARPHAVTVAPDGTLYITDSYNDRVLRIVP